MTNGSKAHVLVVDDDLNLLNLLVDTLQALGYRTTAAHGGVKALELLKEQVFELMVTDIKMPDLDGIQLLKRVRRHYPEMPVLFISGFATPQMIGQASPDGFLAKPFRISHIEALIEATLERKRQPQTRSLRTVLVIERDAEFRTSLIEALSFGHYVPFAAEDGPQALDQLDKGRFDAVIAEFNMPSLDGLELTRRVKEKSPATPVILIGSEQLAVAMAGQSAPFDSYLQKPFNAGAVIELLNHLAPAAGPAKN
ncbi:MAG: response regulator [Candidatus Zixiibacteriota bacterium]